MNSFSQALLAAPVRGLIRALRALGPVRASNLVGGFTRAVGPLLPVSNVALKNLTQSMPELTPPQRQSILRDVWETIGRTVGELPHLAAITQETEFGPGIELIGREHIETLQFHNGPALLFSAHLANWELLLPVAARLGIQAAGIYRAAQNRTIDRILRDLREAGAGHKIKLFPKGARGGKDAMVHLRNNGTLAMLLDQKLNDGIEARFFNRPAMTAPALAQFAIRYNCPVFPVHAIRLGPARYQLVVEPPLPLPKVAGHAASTHTAVAELTQTINDRIEAWVRQAPGSWLWLHRRWPKE